MNLRRFRLAGSLVLTALSLVVLISVAARLFLIGDSQKVQAANSAAETQKNSDDARLAKSYRFERDGWIYVHLEGSPHDIGFQHGFLLAPEIADAFSAVSLDMTHSANRDWDFFRRAARQMLWPRIDPEYQAELQGIVDGLRARGGMIDLDDLVAMNAFMELPDYYVPWMDEKTKPANSHSSTGADHCSVASSLARTSTARPVRAHSSSCRCAHSRSNG